MLNDSHLCSGLGGVCGIFHGVTGAGSNEACSMMETWWILGVFLNGVGNSTVSEPLSLPSSTSDSCWSKAAFTAITNIQIVFRQIADGVYDLMVSRKMWCRLVLWLCQG